MLTIAILIPIAALGLLLLAAGRRGRRVNDHPLCRRCRYDLVGLSLPVPQTQAQARCPECGRSVRQPRDVRIGLRLRRPVTAWAGAVVLLATAGIGWRLHKEPLSLAIVPSWALLLNSEHQWIAPDACIDELVLRYAQVPRYSLAQQTALNAVFEAARASQTASLSPAQKQTLATTKPSNPPKLSTDHTARLVEAILSMEASPGQAWHDSWASVLDTEVFSRGDSARAQRFLDHVSGSYDLLFARPALRAGDAWPVVLRGGLSLPSTQPYPRGTKLAGGVPTASPTFRFGSANWERDAFILDATVHLKWDARSSGDDTVAHLPLSQEYANTPSAGLNSQLFLPYTTVAGRRMPEASVEVGLYGSGNLLARRIFPVTVSQWKELVVLPSGSPVCHPVYDTDLDELVHRAVCAYTDGAKPWVLLERLDGASNLPAGQDAPRWRARFGVRVVSMPVAAAWEIHAEVDGVLSPTLQTLAFNAGGDAAAAMQLDIPGESPPRRFNLVLMPSPAVAEKRPPEAGARFDEPYWAGTVRIRDLPIEIRRTGR